MPTRNNREVIQVRVDLGMLQMEIDGRPDGQRPHGFATYFDYLQAEADKAESAGKEFVLSEEHAEEADREFFDRALELYRQRSDKDWTLTDCGSFVVMRERRLTAALTADRHFEQAGFTALLE